MARIAGVNIPINKHVEIGLTHIYGIGRPLAKKICNDLNIVASSKISALTDEQLDKIRSALANYTIEGDLRREIGMNIKRLTEAGTYRGIRHRKGLPVRGQRTKTNARTRKARRRNSK